MRGDPTARSWPDQPAARFYPSIHPAPDTADPTSEVLGLARNRRDELAEAITHRLVQTNEIGRCAFLAPAIQTAAIGISQPLALLEVGASAGLNLLLDHYGYDYHRGASDDARPEPAGATRPGTPTLQCQLRGPADPPLDQPLRIQWRAVIDPRPINLTEPDDHRWLRALIWPDHRARAAQLDAALTTALATPNRPTVHPGDAATDLPQLVAAVPSDTHLIIYHSAVVAHMPASAQQAFVAAVVACSAHRPISWVQAEPRADRDPRRLRLLTC